MNRSESDPNQTPVTQGERPSPQAVVSVVGWLSFGSSLIALGAATVFSFLRQLQPDEPVPILDRLISFGMMGLFGLVPIAVGVVVVFRTVPTKLPENSTVK